MSFFYDAISLQNGRRTNMDRVSMSIHQIQGETMGLFLMADGVGSAELGEESADFVVNELTDWFFSQRMRRKLATSMSQVVVQLNEELLELCKGRTGATTLSALLLTPQKVYFCHVGDSRIYFSDKGEAWTQLTLDHVNEEGKLTDYLGKNKGLSIDCWEKPRVPGRYLLCTDGFYNLLPWDMASPLLSSAKEGDIRRKLESLALEVIRQGEQDNCSALLVVVD